MYNDKYWFEDLNLIFSERHIQDIIPKTKYIISTKN